MPMLIRTAIVLLLLALPVFVQADTPQSKLQKLDVFVSIVPQQYFVERIGAELVKVHVMVKPGQSPETFEPSPRLMAQYSSADVYFSIGLPFEQVWIQRLASLNSAISVINTRPQQTQLLRQSHEHGHSSSGDEQQQWDPHTWLSPLLAIEQARMISIELSRQLPARKTFFENNFRQLEQQLKQLDQAIAKRFAQTSKHEFLTFHPAFSYFAARYGLTQRAIEMDGKAPSAKQIASLIAQLSGRNIPNILIEQQFNTVIAKTIARSLNAGLLSIDPLAYDYLKNMQDIADKVSRSLF